MKWLRHPAVHWLLALVVGGVFLYACHDKILEPRKFAGIVYRYQVIGPSAALGFLPANLLAVTLPWIELVVGVMLVSGFWRREAAAVAGGLLIVFLAAVGIATAQGIDLQNCGCFSVDEHEDWITGAAGVHTLADRLPAAENLAIQAEAIRGARAFVGTYGGYSYLAPLCRVPALAFHSRPMFKRHHLYAAERAFAQVGAAPLTVVDVGSAPLAQAALGAVTVALS